MLGAWEWKDPPYNEVKEPSDLELMDALSLSLSGPPCDEERSFSSSGPGNGAVKYGNNISAFEQSRT